MTRKESLDCAPGKIAAPLLAWFADARRPLPWRLDYDPYKVWIAEVMLQQTQVETALPYFARWMLRFPSPKAVAAARLESILKAWEGLGYYSRARNLHRAAQAIVEYHGGKIPDDPEALKALPGIGRYTAGAIASIAFNRALPVVDGNVARVLSRVFALRDAVRSPKGQRRLWSLAEQALSPRHPRDFNEALMELGALVCRPRAPACGVCPLAGICRANAGGIPERYPRPAPRPIRPVRRGIMMLAERDGRLLVRKRPKQGLWGGLWEFPWTWVKPEGAAAALKQLIEQAGLPDDIRTSKTGELQHGLTHFELALTVRAGRTTSAWKANSGAWRWVSTAELTRLPMARLSHKALALRNAGKRPSPRRKGG